MFVLHVFFYLHNHENLFALTVVDRNEQHNCRVAECFLQMLADV